MWQTSSKRSSDGLSFLLAWAQTEMFLPEILKHCAKKCVLSLVQLSIPSLIHSRRKDFLLGTSVLNPYMRDPVSSVKFDPFLQLQSSSVTPCFGDECTLRIEWQKKKKCHWRFCKLIWQIIVFRQQFILRLFENCFKIWSRLWLFWGL